MRRKIIAIDFDGTVVTNKFPDIGEPISETTKALLVEIARGSRLILWTCRSGKLLQDALDRCKENEIVFEAVNENLPDIIEAFGGDTRKVFADEYWDDRAKVMPPSV